MSSCGARRRSLVEVRAPAGFDAEPHVHDHESLVYADSRAGERDRVLAVAAAPAPGSSSPAAVLTEAAARLANASSYHAEVRSRLSVGSEAMKMNGGLDVDVKTTS